MRGIFLLAFCFGAPALATSAHVTEHYPVVVAEHANEFSTHVDWVVNPEKQTGHFEVCDSQGCRYLEPNQPELSQDDLATLLRAMQTNMKRLGRASFIDYQTTPPLQWKDGAIIRFGTWFTTLLFMTAGGVELGRHRLKLPPESRAAISALGAFSGLFWAINYLLYRSDRALAPEIESISAQLEKRGENWLKGEPIRLSSSHMAEFVEALEFAHAMSIPVMK